jgi:hypothetical protein
VKLRMRGHCGRDYRRQRREQPPRVACDEEVVAMLERAQTLNGYQLRGSDGDIGAVRGFLFDDQYWTIRYLVADTGSWLSGRQVLISPYALKDVIHERREISVGLTKKQIEGSPPLESDKPVSRQFEHSYFGFFGWPTYWSGPYRWGAYPDIPRGGEELKAADPHMKGWDPHLRSTKQVSGYHMHARDGAIGHVVDFLVDADHWVIRYLIIDTQNWLPGKKVLIAPEWISRVSWDESEVHVDLSCDDIKKSPSYPVESPLTRDYETQLHRHYSREGYWVDRDAVAAHTT